MKNILFYLGYLQWSVWGTRHFYLVVLIRKRTIGAYVVVVVVVVVVILNVTSWSSGVLCYHGYKPARAQQAPLWGRKALKAGLQCSRGRRRDLGAKSTFFSKLQTASLSVSITKILSWSLLALATVCCWSHQPKLCRNPIKPYRKKGLFHFVKWCNVIFININPVSWFNCMLVHTYIIRFKGKIVYF